MPEGEVPNDMAECGDEDIDQLCRDALRTSFCDLQWIESFAERLRSEFHSTHGEDLGPRVTRPYFLEGESYLWRGRWGFSALRNTRTESEKTSERLFLQQKWPSRSAERIAELQQSLTGT